MTRTPYIAGNWKMNLDRAGAVALAREVCAACEGLTDVDVGLFAPFVYLPDVVAAAAGSRVRVGAQNVCDQESGAFTGEISAGMLRDIGVGETIIGHSERRHVYGESDALVNTKVHTALGAGLDVILCVGETLEQREAGETERVNARQLTLGLAGVGDLSRVTIAYEPVWAIGTGRTATPDQAAEVHAYLRGVLAGLYDDERAQATRIQYGGSVKPENAAELMACPDVDGALVGGASLKSEAFMGIVRYR